MLTLCRENQVASANNYSFLRATGTILVEFSYAQCLQANYIAFQNPDYSNKCIGEFLLSELPLIIKNIFNETPIITLKAFPIEHRDSTNMQKIMMPKLCNFYKKCGFIELENKIFYKY